MIYEEAGGDNQSEGLELQEVLSLCLQIEPSLDQQNV